MVFLWWREPGRFYLFLGLILDVGLLFYILYGVPGLRKRKARNMAEAPGVYRLSITEEGITAGDNASCAFDRRSVFLESETALTIRTKSGVFCIPKRILTPELRAELERIAGKKGCPQKAIKTK